MCPRKRKKQIKAKRRKWATNDEEEEKQQMTKSGKTVNLKNFHYQPTLHPPTHPTHTRRRKRPHEQEREAKTPSTKLGLSEPKRIEHLEPEVNKTTRTTEENRKTTNELIEGDRVDEKEEEEEPMTTASDFSVQNNSSGDKHATTIQEIVTKFKRTLKEQTSLPQRKRDQGAKSGEENIKKTWLNKLQR